jgi:hypothetical protein
MSVIPRPVVSIGLIDRRSVVTAIVPMLAVVLMVLMMPMAIVVPRMPMAMAIVGKRRVCPHEKARYPN